MFYLLKRLTLAAKILQRRKTAACMPAPLAALLHLPTPDAHCHYPPQERWSTASGPARSWAGAAWRSTTPSGTATSRNGCALAALSPHAAWSCASTRNSWCITLGIPLMIQAVDCMADMAASGRLLWRDRQRFFSSPQGKDQTTVTAAINKLLGVESKD